MNPVLLPNLFRYVASTYPSVLAVDIPPSSGRSNRQTLTYRELDYNAMSIAAGLRPLVSRECVVPLVLGRESIHLLSAQIGCMLGGGAYASLDPTLPDDRLAFMLKDCDAPAILTERRFAEHVLRLTDKPNSILVVEDLLQQFGIGDYQGEPPWYGPNSLAYIIYTSGTTGRPKGVMIEHKSVANLIHTDIARFGLGVGDRVAQGSSPSYDSSVEEIWLALSVGATVVVLDAETTRLGPDLISWLRDEKIAVFCPPPTLLKTTGCTAPGEVLPDLRLLYVGGEALDQDLARTWGTPFWLENGYGPTECTVTSLRCRVDPNVPVHIGSCVPGLKAHTLNEKGEQLPQGTEGELCLSGVGLARGYLNLPEETSKRFQVHPALGRIYRTGDLVREEATGNYSFLGRIDTQVKIRGHRIELEEIETHSARCEGVSQAACRLQGPRGKEFIVAWIVPDDWHSLPAIEDIRRYLAEQLPSHMVPQRFDFVRELPRSVGGKLARKALPEILVESKADQDFEPCGGEMEALVEHAFDVVLERSGPLSAVAHFFNQLEGDSLKAAMVVSKLRENSETSSVTVKDIYQHPTIRQLATNLVSNNDERSASKDQHRAKPEVRESKQRKPYLAALVQASWMLLNLSMAGPLVWFSLFKIVPWLLAEFSIGVLIVLVPFLSVAIALVLIPIYFGFVVLMKIALVGKYTQRRAPVYGGFYLRHWIVQRLVGLLPWGLMSGTVFQNFALRCLGARIGKRVHIHRGVNLLQGGWDLLELGDDVTLGQGASVRLVDYVDGELHLAPVVIKAGATVDTRAGVCGNATVGAGAYLEALSVLRNGESMPAGELWDGVPAHHVGNAPARSTLDRSGEMGPVVHGVLSIIMAFLFNLIFLLPWLGAIWLSARVWDIGSDEVIRWIAQPEVGSEFVWLMILLAFVGAPLGLMAQALFCRLLGKIETGCVSRWSFTYILVWTKTGAVDAANNVLSGTLFWPMWLRLSGMKIGRNSEVSTIIDVVPEHIEIGTESFFADGIYLGGPRIHQGRVDMRRTKVGSNTFFGNHAVIEAGSELPDDILLGICTKSHDAIRQGSSWFGHPVFELPRREVITMPREVTHDPGFYLFSQRLFWETMRFALPLFPLATALLWFVFVSGRLAGGVTAQVLFVDIPLLGAAMALTRCLGVLVLKWALLGKIKPGQHGFWSSWCSRWDFLYVAWGAWARGILALLEGTPFLHWYLRAMGVRIGRSVTLSGGFAQVVDPDMIHIEDGATVNGLFQAHSFEDRVLKMDHVHIRQNATTHDGSVLLYGADIGSGSHVMHHSVVMKKERLLPDSAYEGAPTSRCDRP
ncbi:MAG: non-ribosomal peptide synthetase-like protein [Planctomycetota bacterium]|jgi:non-ribosomal peptide synthetase-like protein